MFAQFYQNGVLKNPKTVFVLLIIAILSFGYYSKDFRLDASSETLLIEGDPDLAYLKEVTERYGSKDFLILTYTPNEGMVTDSSINNLLSLKYKIQSLNWVHSVVTLLDIPLLNNSDAPLQERLESFKTLKDEDVDRNRGFKEILNSPVFRNFVISEDGNTSGIIVNIKENKKLENIENLSKEEIEAKVSEIADQINNDYRDKELIIIGILKGAFIVISDLAKNLSVDVTFDFMSLKSYEGLSSTGQIKIDKDLDTDITGKNILIVEDILDTGLTLSHLKNLLESRNPKSIEMLCIFVKKDVAKEPVEIKYKGFEIGPEFVVGYGLDYNGKYRELPYLAVLAED